MLFPDMVFAVKVHASGNDFVLIAQAISHEQNFKEWVIQVCDRKFGIGSDGVIFIDSEAMPPRFKMWNPDGSLSGMCGNGLRCAIKWLTLEGKQLTEIETDSGTLNIFPAETGGEIELGPAKFDPVDIPCAHQTKTFLNQEMEVPLLGSTVVLRLSAVNFGNPHAVFYGEFGMDDFSTISKFLQVSDLFPQSVNVHQMQDIGAGRVRMQSFERGAGLTLACGSGACAVATLHRRLLQKTVKEPGRDWIVEMPGGEVAIKILPTGHVRLSGAANIVATIKIPDPKRLGSGI